VALRPEAAASPTGLILVAEATPRHWSDSLQQALMLLAQHFAWVSDRTNHTTHLTSENIQLKHLNWYKHQLIEELEQSILTTLKKLNEIGIRKDSIHAIRQQQILRDLNDSVAAIPHLLADERWTLQMYAQVISLPSLLKRLMNRLEPLMTQHKLRYTVHRPLDAIIAGDVHKIELVLYAMLRHICHQAPSVGGRIEFTNRQLSASQVELAIVHPKPVATFKPALAMPNTTTNSDRPNGEPNGDRSDGDGHGRAVDGRTGRRLALATESAAHPLATVTLPPEGEIWQAVMQQLGGEVHWIQGGGDRLVSRVILPLARNHR
jgi:hypothetical protein